MTIKHLLETMEFFTTLNSVYLSVGNAGGRVLCAFHGEEGATDSIKDFVCSIHTLV